MTFKPAKKNVQKCEATVIRFRMGQKLQEFKLYGHANYFESCIPPQSHFTYDQEAQEIYAKELLDFVKDKTGNKKIFSHIEGEIGYDFFKHFSRLLKNEQDFEVIGMLLINIGNVRRMPAGILLPNHKIFDYFQPLFLLFPITFLYLASKRCENSHHLTFREFTKLYSKAIIENYRKTKGPFEWSVNHLLERENENCPMMFVFFGQNQVLDQIIDKKRMQNEFRIVEAYKYNLQNAQNRETVGQCMANDIGTFLNKCIKEKYGQKKKKIIDYSNKRYK